MVSQGDIIRLDFDPQAGHEQRGRRPALIISNDVFNRYTGLRMVCPITRTKKNHPFHIPLDDRTRTDGVILCDQARILDIKARHYEYIERLPQDLLEWAKELIIGFIE
jgi:mRNA interferase MazF